MEQVFKRVPLRTTLPGHHPSVEHPGVRSLSPPPQLCTTILYLPRFFFMRSLFTSASAQTVRLLSVRLFNNLPEI